MGHRSLWLRLMLCAGLLALVGACNIEEGDPPAPLDGGIGGAGGGEIGSGGAGAAVQLPSSHRKLEKQTQDFFRGYKKIRST